MAKKNSGNGTAARTTVRCAIYTRKSTEEGWGQDFNSLDAQRDSGEAYIRSQFGSGGEKACHYSICEAISC